MPNYEGQKKFSFLSIPEVGEKQKAQKKKEEEKKLGLSWATLEKEQQIFEIGVGFWLGLGSDQKFGPEKSLGLVKKTAYVGYKLLKIHFRSVCRSDGLH